MPPRHPGIELALLGVWLAWSFRMAAKGGRFVVLRTRQVNTSAVALAGAAIAAIITACEGLLP